MSTVQTKQVQNKKKKRRSQVTFEDSTQFLARPIQKIEDLDKSLRKSYEKGFFRHERFQGLKQLKEKFENKENDSLDSQLQSDQSVFSIHNDQRTIRRRERQRQMKKASIAKSEQVTNPDKNQKSVAAKPKRSRKPQPKQKTQQQKKMKEQEQEKKSSKQSERSESSSSGSSNSDSSSSQQSQSGSESESENQKQKEKSEQQQHQPPQTADKKYNLKPDNVERWIPEEIQSEEIQSEENQSEQYQSQLQQSVQKQEPKLISNSETQAKKYMIEDPKEAVEKQNIKTQQKPISAEKKSVSPQRNNRRAARRRQNEKDQSSQQKLDQPQTPTPKPTPNQPITAIKQPKQEDIKIKSQPIKMTQQSLPRVINQAQPQINVKYKPKYTIQPTKRQHHLEHCPKVVVQSLYFRNHYIVAPYLAVSQLSTPYTVPYQPSSGSNIIRLKKVTEKMDEQQQIEPAKTMSQLQKPPKPMDPPISKKGLPDLVAKPLRSRRRR